MELRFLLGRNKQRKTLGTEERAPARTRYLQKAAEVEARWSRLRSGDAALVSSPIEVQPALCARDAEAPVGRSFVGWPGRSNAFRSEPVGGLAPILEEVDPYRPTASGRPVFEAYATEAKLAPSTDLYPSFLVRSHAWIAWTRSVFRSTGSQ